MNRCRKRATQHASTADLIDSRNIVLAGTSMVAGQAKAVVFATGMRTEFGKIAHLTQTAGDDVSPLRTRDRAFEPLIALLAALIGGSCSSPSAAAIGVPFWKAFIFAIGIIVAMVPEGLLPTLTLSLVLATQRMAKRNVLIRYLPSVETLGSTTVICTDKTGTLTQNRMSVQATLLGDTIESPDGAREPRPTSQSVYRPVLRNGRGLCHDLKQIEQHGRHVVFSAIRWRSALVEMALPCIAGQSAIRRASTSSRSMPTACGCRRCTIRPEGLDALLQGRAGDGASRCAAAF